MKRMISTLLISGVLLSGGAIAAQGAQASVPAASHNGATAKCRDGTYSYSAHRRGTCSWHKGVAVWYKNVPA